MIHEVDIIIPNWNGREWLGDCLVSLRQQTFTDFRIIVVDNGSTDDSAEYLREQFPEVQLIELDTNRGFTGGTNVGMRAGSAPYICWFNNDAVAAPDFLEQLLDKLKANEPAGFGMAAARVVFRATPHIINSAGSFVGPDGIGRDRGFRQVNGPAFAQALELFGPAGVAALYKREIFERVGMLDEDFFLYSEEVDLNYRAQLAGYRCIYVPSAHVLHRGSATARQVSHLAARLASRNGLLTIIKNLPRLLLLKFLPWIIAGQIYQLILFARQGNFFPALAGKFEVFELLPTTLAKRKIIQQESKLTISQFARQMKLGRTNPRFLQKFLNPIIKKERNYS